jgi:hypothetical protein
MAFPPSIIDFGYPAASAQARISIMLAREDAGPRGA